MKSASVLEIAVFAFILLLVSAPVTSPIMAQAEMPFHLAELGPYAIGRVTVDYVDTTRADRRVNIRILYPAIRTADAGTASILRGADPDRSGAPYPLIITGYNDGDAYGPYLPSHGFVMAVVTDSAPIPSYDDHVIDFPRDIVLALGQLASNPPELLIGVIDTDHTGVMGYSWDGYGALAVSGARFDPEHYLSACTDPALETLGYPGWWNDYACSLMADWDAFVAEAGAALTTSDDGLWQPITDERIRAVAPGAPEGALLFGPRGLATVDRPTLIIAGTEDSINVYSPEAVYIFEHLGAADRTLISFVGAEHASIVYTPELFRRLRHFVTAFFGFHLQGREAYTEFFDQSYVEQFDDLAWGVYSGE